MYDLDKGVSLGYRPIGGPELSIIEKRAVTVQSMDWIKALCAGCRKRRY